MKTKNFWIAMAATPAVLSAILIAPSTVLASEQLELFETFESFETFKSFESFDSLETNLDFDEPHRITIAEIDPSLTPSAPLASEPFSSEFSSNSDLLSQAEPVSEVELSEVEPVSEPVSEVEPVSEFELDLQSQALPFTSVNALSDVQPTDWAYQALQSLVERYGCIVGYPDRTFRGNSALTRYEFAAGLNACLDRITELISVSLADFVTREDLATLQRLQEEFAGELATIRGRVDSLEARVAELEANQFSTTTRLQGETIFAIGAPITEDDRFSDQIIGGYRARLNFNTSFTGEDLLRARTQAVTFDNYEGFGGTVGATAWKVGTNDGDNNFFLDQLIYVFPAGDRFRFTIGGVGVGASDLVTSTVSPFDSDLYAVLGFGFPPSYYFIPGGVGAGGSIQLTENLAFDFGYGATNESGPDPTAGRGLFNGDYGVVAQLTFLSDLVDAFLLYGNGYRREGFFTDLGLEGGPAVSNSYGGYINFKFGSLEVGGGITYVPIRQIQVGDYDVWSYQAGLIIRDLGVEGNDFGIQAGVAPYASSVPFAAISPGANLNQDNSVIVQGFYSIRLNDNLQIIPGAAWISAPDNDRDNDGTVVGLVKTAFTF